MNLNVVKGLLVLLVVVDHNDFSRSVFPGFLYGFTFHVVGFMTLPFLRPAPAIDRQFGQYLFRLYWPFVVIASALALAVALLTPVAPLYQFQGWALTLYSGNSGVVKETTHMAMLWFLPSFVALVALRSGIDHIGRAGRVLAIVALCALHPLIGVAPERIANYLPLGLLPALYMVPLTLVIAWGHVRLLARLPRLAGLALTVLVYALVKSLQMKMHLYNEVGFAEVADYTQPLALLVNDLEAVTGVWMVFQLGRFSLGSLIETAGKYSLQVYLFHAFVAFVLYKLLIIIASGAHPALLFCVSFALTAVLATLLGRFLAEQGSIRRLLFPRTTAELAGALRWPALGGQGAVAASKPEPRHHDR
jgi:fucose 4-O-acetylase-like acetyltransferase